MDTLNQNINLKLSIWLFALCLMIVAMIFIGGVTRLTGSGLSMVEWRPILGFLPPLNIKNGKGCLTFIKIHLNIPTIIKECYFQILNLFFSGNIFIDYGEE